MTPGGSFQGVYSSDCHCVEGCGGRELRYTNCSSVLRANGLDGGGGKWCGHNG